MHTQEKDIKRCINIVRNELLKKNVYVDDNVLRDITIDIMNISESKGGGYSNAVIKSFSETYISEGFYRKFIDI